MPVEEFEEQLGLTPGHNESVRTPAELVVECHGERPKVGHYVLIDGWRMEICDMDGVRVDKLIVQRDTTARMLGAHDLR